MDDNQLKKNESDLSAIETITETTPQLKTAQGVENQDEEHKALGHFHEEDYIDSPPDGGYTAWICCACVCAMNMVTWGANSAFAIFLAFYLENDMFPGATPTDYAMIGGIVIFFTLTLLPYSSIMLVKYGYKTTVSIGIIIQLAAYIGSSFATTLLQLYWTQGILMGISSGIIFGANTIVLPSWFLRKRSLANGLSHFGLGLGGAWLSLVVNALIQRTGDQKWALRVLGLISFTVCSSTMFLVKIRESKHFLELKEKSTMELLKDVMDYKVWLSIPLQLASLWAFLANIGYVTCLFSLSNYARSLGYTSNQATMVTVSLSLAQAFGRPVMGYFSEKFGRVNFTFACNLYICILIFLFWMNIHNYAAMICFAVFLGFTIGISSINIVILVADVSGLAKFPSALTYANTAVAVSSIIAEVIALNLRDYSLAGVPNRTPYFYCQIFVGCIYFAALFVLIPYRSWKVDRMLFQLKDSKRLEEHQRLKYTELNNDRSVKAFFKKAFYLARV